MKGTLKGFLLTAAAWLVLIGMYSGIELLRGHLPFEMLRWNVGGKFITITILFVLTLGTAIGYSSDRIRERMRAHR